jgi:two-component system, chemotaxis family, CheB/CheR fusion protein
VTSTDDKDRRGRGGKSPKNRDVAAPVDSAPKARLPFPVVGIGASAGGIQALEEFFTNVDADSGMAYVVVQHLSPDHTSMLGEILGRDAKIPVEEIKDGVTVRPNHAYVIAPGFTLTLEGGKLHLGDPVDRYGHRRPIDDFLKSLAEEQMEMAIAVILSGTGTNGTAGCQAIKAGGGICIAQDPDTAAFPGMPQSLIHAGYADQVLKPDEIPGVLKRYVGRPYLGVDDPDSDGKDALLRDRSHIREIIGVLRARTRHDFAGYRKPTLLRRVQRRMSLTACETLSDYGAVLRENAEEVTSLANDLMINVTGFFRDPEAWEALRTSVLAPLVASRSADQPLRAWVTACASGEEPYTLAMILAEEMRGRDRIEVKIFATDTAERSLALARAGVYPAGIEADISRERLERFFDKDEHTYRVKKEIRDMVVFAPQDVLRDPPFSRVDLCCCRNLLIYLEPETQRRVLSLLHFALRDGGYLFLGNTESYSGSEHLFELISKRWRIYRRTGSAQHRFSEVPSFTTRARDDSSRQHDLPLVQATTRPSATLVLQRALLERYGPPTVVVDRSDQVVYYHGATDAFLLHPAGEPTRDLMQLVRQPLRLTVRTALRAATRENQRSVAQTPAEGYEGPQIEVTAAPVIEGKTPEYFLVSFRVMAADTENQERDEQAADHLRTSLARDPANIDEVRMLRLELQNTTEAFEAANEELKAANEEATSMNEELQSTNEELETSKEELQSVNEELTTVNNQLQAKIAQLEATTNDLANLLGSTDIAVIFLDAEFRVRRFTPAINDLVELRESDLGRPVTDLAQKFTDDKLLPDARAVLQKLVPVEREIRSHSGRWYLRRTLPYRTAENHIEGVVITFVDIAARKLAEAEILSTQARLQSTLEQMPTAVVMVQAPGGRLLFANKQAASLFNNSFPTPVPGDPMPAFYPILAGRHAGGEFYRAEEWPLARALAANEAITDQEVTVTVGDGRELSLLMGAAPVRDPDGKTVAVVGTFTDITQRKSGERRLSQVEERFKMLVESARDFAIFAVDTKGRVLTWNAGAERILGWPEKEIIGQWGAILFTPEDRGALVPEEELRQAEETGRATDERWHIRKDGTRFWASGVMAAVRGRDGEVEAFVKIMRDETDRKLAEDRLLAATATAERAEAVAIEANRAKDDFIAVVSHELRTPLNTIRLWARMLRNEKLSPKDREEGIQMVERAAVAQQQVIDDLFDVSRIAAGKLRLTMRPTRLGDAIRGAIDAVEPVATSRGIRLSTDVSNDIGTVRADPGRIQQVVWNLLSNAVKFTPAGGKVHVAARRTGGNVLIEVADTGIGIRPEFLEKIFERFRQVDIGPKRAHAGLGLGLSIAKQLVELHEGTISARSQGEGKGTIFCVTLPLVPQEGLADAPADESGNGSDLRGVDVLVVEDEGMTRDTMRRLLEGAAAKVRTVDSVAAAREALDKRVPQILVSDIGMPGEDGYALIRYLRSMPKTSHVITVAVTAFARPEDRRQVLDAGYDEHLSKPLDADQLLATLARLVQR